FRLYFEGLGTLAPSFLASERPIATACLLEVTFLPLPVLRFPSFISSMVSSTFSPDFFDYFAIILECLSFARILELVKKFNYTYIYNILFIKDRDHMQIPVLIKMI